MKKYINGILSLSSIAILFYIVFNQKEQIANLQSKINSIEHERDSLRLEILSKEIEVGRYESAINRAEDEMSFDCKQQLEKILHETE